MARVKNTSEGFIDYRLNIMGLRVWWDSCQLIAKRGEKWEPIGPRHALPVTVPGPSQAVQAAGDEVRMTAFQFQTEHPESDLAAVLSQSKSFHVALHGERRTEGKKGA